MGAPNVEDHLVLESRSVNHWFGPKKVLYDINLKVVRGQIVSLVGPSGCGKSTLLRAIVGTHLPKSGEIVTYSGEKGHAGDRVTGPGRDRGIVYQHYSLFPFLTAQQNVAFGLMLDQTSLPFRILQFPKWRRLRKQHLEEAAAFLDRLGLGDAVHKYPHELSGGMRQRVAIAQALIMKPEITLLDEPFGALDEATREDLQRMLLKLYLENRQAKDRGEKPPYTIFIVTHELNEALYVGDRIIGLSQYWNWRESDHEEAPGATIVYDKKAPVFEPDEDRNYELLEEQRDEIRQVVFDPKHLQDRDEFRKFWRQVKREGGHGVVS